MRFCGCIAIALAKAGHHVIYCQSRYPNNDSALIMEKVAIAGEFDETPGTGIAFQLDIERAIGVRHQIEVLTGKGAR